MCLSYLEPITICLTFSFISSLSSSTHIDHSLQNCQHIGRHADCFVQAVQSSLQYLSKVKGIIKKIRRRIMMIISFWQWKMNKISLGSRNYMGASFQAPCAAPRQRPMEMYHVSLILVYISVCFYDKSHRYVQK